MAKTTLREMRAEKNRRAPIPDAAPLPAPIPDIQVNAGDPTPAIEQLAAVVTMLMQRLTDMEANNNANITALIEKLDATVEVNAGDTTVNIPQRASRFEIEYDSNKLAVALVPIYDE